jgi:hypothetical protein
MDSADHQCISLHLLLLLAAALAVLRLLLCVRVKRNMCNEVLQRP